MGLSTQFFVVLTYRRQDAKKNGITRTEIAKIITHIVFYAGEAPARAAADRWFSHL